MNPLDQMLLIAGIIDPKEREAAKAVLAQATALNIDPMRAIEAIRLPPEYEEEPVDIRTFCEDPYFLNLEGQVWPVLLDDLGEFFNGTYVEAVLKGAIGWGKSTFAELSVLYMIYLTACLKDPQRYYGLMRGSSIAFVNISVNKPQAQRVIFRGVRAKAKNSPYFRESFPYDPYIESELRFPKDIWLAPMASVEGNVLGLNVLGGIMDETNFMPVVERSKMMRTAEPYDAAVTLYNAIARRLQSRFNVMGKIPGKMIVVSSSKYPDDFTERKAREADTDPSIFVRTYAQWETKPAQVFLPERFQVEVGDQINSSRILEEGMMARPGSEVLDVPLDFRKAFEKDPDGAVRDIAGRTVSVVEPFIRRRELIVNCIDQGRKHPWPMGDIVSGNEIQIEVGEIAFLRDGVWRPKFHPTAIRTAHVDLALTADACGVALGCSPERKTVLRFTPEGESYEEVAPVIWYDLLMRVRAPGGGEIDIAAIRGFLIGLVKYGFKIRRVTYDGFQSAESIQQFKKKGIDSYVQSVDSTMEPYECLKMAIYEARASYYELELVNQELRRLTVDRRKRKVDHPPHGSKDVTDAMAAVAYHWTADRPAEPLMPSPGLVETKLVGAPLTDEEDYSWVMKD